MLTLLIQCYDHFNYLCYPNRNRGTTGSRISHFCDILFIFFVLRYDILRCRLDRYTPSKCMQRRTKTFAFSCKILHKLTLIFIPTKRYVTVVTMIGIDVADVHISKGYVCQKKVVRRIVLSRNFQRTFYGELISVSAFNFQRFSM